VEFEVEGEMCCWESRWARKHPQGSFDQGTWWAPEARGWWIGVLFAIGSVLFALGAAPGYLGAVGGDVDALTYFAGSVFFTSAGFLQYRESVDAGRSDPDDPARFFVLRPHQIDWWASGIQLLGTVFFNISTAYACEQSLSTSAIDRHVWRPDALGSICFLVASALAWFEVSHAWSSFRPRELAWWITLLNLAGSVAFGVSAVASFVVPSTGQLRSETLTNLGTFVGALCFVAGALLLLPERKQFPTQD
jgi:hypothetical protein